MFKDKVNILGTEYSIATNEDDKNPKMEGAYAYVELLAKQIVLNKTEETGRTMLNIEEFDKKVLRHEIIHAFLFESGMYRNCSWARKEECVDWIALQIPKMYKAMADVGAI